MRPIRIVSIVVFIVAVVFWVTGISSANASTFFEDQFAVQTLVLGGALAMIAGLLAFIVE